MHRNKSVHSNKVCTVTKMYTLIIHIYQIFVSDVEISINVYIFSMYIVYLYIIVTTSVLKRSLLLHRLQWSLLFCWRSVFTQAAMHGVLYIIEISWTERLQNRVGLSICLSVRLYICLSVRNKIKFLLHY